MKKLFRKENEGFTIIEVVLVLAIAGLIFLVVFLALPQLQRSRRDTQRRSDAGRILASLETYSSNHNGVYPKADIADAVGNFGLDAASDSLSFIAVYFKADNFEDPSDGQYVNVPVADLNSRPGNITYVVGYDCSNPSNAGSPAARVIRVTMKPVS